MKKILTLGILVIGAIAAWWFMGDDNDEARYERAETELVISNLAHATLTLYNVGKNLGDTSRLAVVGQEQRWLRAGNYFLQCGYDGAVTFQPIPLTGYRCGPDKDGSFLVTIRPMPREFPPKVSNDSPDFMYIPSGNCLIGDRQNPREPHYVWLTGYFIAPFETTNGEYRQFMDARDGYGDDANWTGQGRKWKSVHQSRTTALLQPKDKEYKRFGQPDQPVTWVNWFEANAYCKWLTRKHHGRKWLFTLPSDAEWEKAARGPDNFDFALTMNLSDGEVHLYNWRKNPWEDTTVVGIHESVKRFKPNRFGLYHMTGNVAEWTQSMYKPYNRDHPYQDDGRNHDNADGRRTVRGGSWYSAAISYMCIPYRDAFQSEHSTHDVGFRVVAKALP
jgi:formylglycine-generating enzyme required for sulfatase activity